MTIADLYENSSGSRQSRLIRPAGENEPPPRVLKQADRIARFWHERGCEIEIRVEQQQIGKHRVWAIRSDMRGGLPRSRSAQQLQAERLEKIAPVA